MAGGAAWSRRGAARARALRGLVRDTQRALQDVTDVLNVDPEVSSTVHDIGTQANSPAVLVILGSNRGAQARLLHALLGRRLLQPLPEKHIWLKIQYGSSTQAHLSLGNSEFELVEELECNKGAWDSLPVEDLIRQDHMDLATILEIELSNPFLKDGLQIVIPPDIDSSPSATYQQLKELNSELYTKRHIILKTFNPIFLYAIDKIGDNVFAEHFCDMKIKSKSEEDFWSTYNLYYMTRSEQKETENEDEEGVNENEISVELAERKNEPCVFTSENCLDLHQIKEVNPNAQLFFFLLSDSSSISSEDQSQVQHQVEPESEVVKIDKDLDDDRTEHESLAPSPNELSPQENKQLHDEEQPHDERTHDEKCVNDERKVERRTNDERATHNERGTHDGRRLHDEQCTFMSDLMDQWETMSAPVPKYAVKSQWAILDDNYIMRAVDQKVLGEKAPGETAKSLKEKHESDRVVKSRTLLLNKIVKFAADSFQNYILEYCTKLSEVHVKVLQQLILSSFDLARQLQLLPRKIQYVAEQEQLLYQTISAKFSGGEKRQELLLMMQGVLDEMRDELQAMDWSVDDLPCHQDKQFLMSNSVYYESTRSPESTESIQRQTTPGREQADSDREHSSDDGSSDVEEAVSYDSYNFDDYEIINSNDESLMFSDYSRNSEKLNLTEMSSVSEWRARSSTRGDAGSYDECPYKSQVSAKQAALDVQRLVLCRVAARASRRLAGLLRRVDRAYCGTLTRCLDSLEAACGSGAGAGRAASAAMGRLLGAARRLQLEPRRAPLAACRDCLRRLLLRFRLSGAAAPRACCSLAPAWRRAAAADTLRELSATRLARMISAQILERLTSAHETYQAALAALEGALAPRLHRTEDNKLAIRKRYAPGFARLCLESTSMCDLLKYGMPELGREIGRGQYGVVYGVRGGWAGRGAVCGKSVLPADDRHYSELAMELFYTRSIPAHPRVVPVWGSLVSRLRGAPPSVLLLSPRYVRDLHCAVRAGLPAATRLDIAIDIVEGIRYLHSLGLVHRDIKLKNVLLDAADRAALADLGFCCAGALLSGSVVGTPVHMAPDLLAQDYGPDVDVYAFGILFWYLCAGSVKLPEAFECFQNKEELWNKVARGRRPERLPHFSDACWDIMTSCWDPAPPRRPLPGSLLRRLRAARGELREGPGGGGGGEGSEGDMTGLD